MQRREFLSSSVAAGWVLSAGTGAALSAAESPMERDSNSVFYGAPVVSGPAADSITILQAVNGPASGYVEWAVGEEPFQRASGEVAGLLPYDEHVLKFVLPSLPAGKEIRYRVVARKIHFKTDYNIQQGEPIVSETFRFRTLNPAAHETRFVVWNDTHENLDTIRKLQKLSTEFSPDFMLWNGDQTNNVHEPSAMREQYLSPGQLPISSNWPMAYARGNHDLRGPAAREVARFTGTPGDQFYYAFRSGPLAALVMDTGEDKPDERDVFAGLAGFDPFRERQRLWLQGVIEQDWFRSAPYRVLFCHIPLWWKEETAKRDFWMCAERCREDWLPLLVKAKVQLIVSGHVHQDALLPASATQPIPQLTGGGPKPDKATVIEGVASGSSLKIVCRSLSGEVRHSVEIFRDQLSDNGTTDTHRFAGTFSRTPIACRYDRIDRPFLS